MSNRKDNSPADWHREDVMCAIRKRGSTLAEIARSVNTKPATAYNVFHRRYPRFERLIADFLELQPEEIWPSRYANRNTKIRAFIGTSKQVA
jgi:Ner family transcriptional regulator